MNLTIVITALVTVLLNLITTFAVMSYFYGRLVQKVSDHERRLGLLEKLGDDHNERFLNIGA